jgi:peptidoglycan hydrolase CwlO-like protein
MKKSLLLVAMLSCATFSQAGVISWLESEWHKAVEWVRHAMHHEAKAKQAVRATKHLPDKDPSKKAAQEYHKKAAKHVADAKKHREDTHNKLSKVKESLQKSNDQMKKKAKNLQDNKVKVQSFWSHVDKPFKSWSRDIKRNEKGNKARAPKKQAGRYAGQTIKGVDRSFRDDFVF